MAVRFLHFPHMGLGAGAPEAAGRGHGPLVQLLADIVSGFNMFYEGQVYEGAEVNPEKELVFMINVAKTVREHGFPAWVLPLRVDDSVRYTVLIQLTPQQYFAVLESPHDEIPLLHLVSVYTDLPPAYARIAIRKTLEKLLNEVYDEDVYQGLAEVIYRLDTGQLEINQITPEEETVHI